jgi:RND family efflux transporter MFP subunit
MGSMDHVTSSPRSTLRVRLAGAGVLLCISAALLAQGPPPAVVRYTVAREHTIRRTLTLPGTVEPRTASTIASTVEGQVTDFPAKEGMRVRKDQVLARLDTVPLELRRDVQRAALKEAEARLKLAESNLARARELFAATVISRQQLDDNQSEFTAWQGRVDSLRAEIARIEEDIARCTIRSPIAGVVVRERTEVGQWMDKGGAVVDLLAMDTVEVRVDMPERYFASLRVGAAATATFESLPGYTARGRVLAVIPEADRQSRTFPVKIEIPNEQGRVGAGMLAQVSLQAAEYYRATLVPKDAVISRGERKLLYRLNGESSVEEVAVETGTGVGAWVEVRGPVRAGDKVITRGNERLRPGQPVQASALEYERP